MPRPRLTAAVLLCLALAGTLAANAGAGGALVAVNSLILRADGGFRPRSLPRRQFVPIDFQGHFDIAAKGGGKPVALEEAVIDFDRDGRLSPAGLPTCPAERVAGAGSAEARRLCAGALVGSGHIEALVAQGSGAVAVAGPLTLFNGPAQEGNPTVVLHARLGVAATTQTFAIVIPIERRPGQFRYRATLELPPIAAGLGAVTHVDVKVGRRFSAGGQRRSYVSAHCSDQVLQTHGYFRFADGTVIDGSVEKPCTPR
jgi:hypothetical protein